MSGDEKLKQTYHEQHLVSTYNTLQAHVDFIVQELDDLSKSRKKEDENHPRLPLLMNHNLFVRDIFYLVQMNLDELQ